MIGLFWMGHHEQFSYIRRVDGVMLWLNLFFLMTIGLIPFVTSLLSDHGTVLATCLYAGTLVTTSLLSAAMWWYADRDPRAYACGRARVGAPRGAAVAAAERRGVRAVHRHRGLLERHGGPVELALADTCGLQSRRGTTNEWVVQPCVLTASVPIAEVRHTSRPALNELRDREDTSKLMMLV